jgi:hypothetical protein
MKDRVLIFDPKPGATPDDVMQILKLFTFQTYPQELRTKENLMALFDQLPDTAKKHFEVKTRNV